MRALLAVLGLVWRAERRALLRGAALSVLVLGAGAALLGLSGWFITAAAAAGLAGAGLVFDVFRPSAGVRLLALGRTAARYGERLFTHDATLRALAALRVQLLAGLARADWTRQERLRSAAALTRLTADVDALDAAPLRLALPLGAGLAAQGLAAAAVAWLADPAVALWILGANAAGAVGVALLGGRAASAHARRGEHALQALRLRTVDLVRGRADLAAAGLLAEQARAVAEAARRRAAAQARLDALERAAGLALGLAVLAAAGGALLLGLAAVEAGRISPAQAATGPFVALALGETLMPVRRAAAEGGGCVLPRGGCCRCRPRPRPPRPGRGRPHQAPLRPSFSGRRRPPRAALRPERGRLPWGVLRPLCRRERRPPGPRHAPAPGRSRRTPPCRRRRPACRAPAGGRPKPRAGRAPSGCRGARPARRGRGACGDPRLPAEGGDPHRQPPGRGPRRGRPAARAGLLVASLMRIS